MITAETAVVLPALVALLALLLGVLGHGLDQAKAVDAARNGARAAARGESSAAIKQAVLAEAPPGSQIQIDVSGSKVTVEVAAPARSLFGLISLPGPHAESVALLEGSTLT